MSGPGGPWSLRCRDCDGTGHIPFKQVGWQTIGKQLRNVRLSHDLTGREAARLLGIRASDYSDAEFGRVDPAPVLAASLAALTPKASP